MITKWQKERMEIAKNTISTTNSIGTALYILGFSNKDEYIGIGEKRWDSGEIHKLLESMIKLESPREGALLVLSRDNIVHMGFVVSDEPALIYHRNGHRFPIEKNVPLENVVKYFGGQRIITEFYINK